MANIAEKETALSVPFSQKNIAKNLGAKWNPELKSWFAPAGCDLDVFKDFAAGTNLDAFKDSAHMTDIVLSNVTTSIILKDPLTANDVEIKQVTAENSQQSLSAYMGKIGDVVRRNFAFAQWVQVEVSKITDRGNNVYFDFVEYSEQGLELAKARGTLWGANRHNVIKKFKIATGGDIKDGMKILVKMRPEFSGQYGFSLMVEDIDPSYTLGEMQLKIKQIRDALIKEGIYAKNKSLSTPREFTRIAVISPEGAAGLADFMRESEVLHAAGLCHFDYFTAVFQGKSSQQSLLSTLYNVIGSFESSNVVDKYDAVVIIRGGGAAADLAWLNDYEIAKTICLSPTPVFTGIGHQVDDTVLDEVSNIRFDTPSKVSAYITSVIVNNANEAVNNMAAILNGSSKVIALAESKLETLMLTVKASSLQVLTKYESELPMLLRSIKTAVESKIATTEQSMQNMMNEVLGLSPKNTLARGYAVIRDANGKPVTSANNVTAGSFIEVELKDGKIKATTV